MNIAVEAARRRGAKAFIADYIATPKNRVISALYPSLGFAAVDGSATRWFLNLEDYVAQNSHIVPAGATIHAGAAR
jgi:predicted enzyme involved in methoxymalonyl-ACP biosynthesis